MLNFFFSNIKPTFVQEETINEGFVFITKAFVFINEAFVFRSEAFILSIHSKKGKSYQGRALVLIASVSKIESYLCRKELFHHRGHREHRGYNYL